jgi:hypothetical protein
MISAQPCLGMPDLPSGCCLQVESAGGAAMHLSVRTYKDILRSLRSDATRAGERRKHPRVGLRAKTIIHLVDSTGRRAAPQEVWVRDISVGGIGLVVNHPMKRGRLFLLELLGEEQQKLHILYQVMQCHPADLIVGARIVRQLTPAESAQLKSNRKLEIDGGRGN